MTVIRTTIPDFQLANPLYTASQVSFFTVDGLGHATSTLATLYAGPTGPITAANPQTLDATGKFLAPVYIDAPVIANVVGPNVASHSTGVIDVRGTWRGNWAAGAILFSTDLVQDPVTGSVYVAAADYTSAGSIVVDIAAGNLVLILNRAAALNVGGGYLATIAAQAVATWTKFAGPDANAYVDAAWSPELGLFAATAPQAVGAIKTSPDGINWTARTVPNSAWHGIDWSPQLGLFCAVGGGNVTSNIITSPDGVTWTTRTAPNTNNWDGLVWAPQLGLFVAVGYTGTGNRVMTSPDGINWTARVSAADNNWSGITWSGSLLVAVANSGTGNRVMTSPDGINWLPRTVAIDRNWDDVAWSPQLGLFCAVSYSGTADSVMTSPDGIAWTLHTTPTTDTWTRIAWSPELGLFAATGAPVAGTSNVMTSPDGATWATHLTGNESWGGIAWSPELGIFAALSWTGDSMISTPPPVKRSFATQYGGLVGIGTTASLANRGITISAAQFPFGGIGFAAPTTLTELWALGYEPGTPANRFVLFNTVTGTYAAIFDPATNNLTLGGGTAGNGGAVGSISFGNATSGLVNLRPVTGALGSPVLSLPAATDTLVGKATTDTLTNKTYDTAGAGNVFRINGTGISAITGAGSVVLATSPTLTTPTISGLATISTNVAALPAGAAGTLLRIGASDGTAALQEIQAFGSAAVSGNSPAYTFRTARGTAVSPTALQSGDYLGFVAGIGYGATGYSTVSRAAISFVTSQIWTDANQGAAVQVETTPNGSTSRAVAARFGPSGGFSVGTLTDPGIGAILANTSILSQSPTNGIGYATGAGGTIGQATSKATSVALNTICGAVTMANALLAAGTVVSFVLQDTAIAATDVLVLNHISGGTPGSYSLNAQAAAGSATINVRNNTAGSLSEAIVIQFVVIKGVNA